MKLICSLPPRADGTVVLHCGGAAIVFKRGSSVELEGDVPDDLALAALDTGNFYPATEDDEKAAATLQDARAKAPSSKAAPAPEPAHKKPASGKTKATGA